MNTTSTTGLPRTQALILAGGRGERLSPLTVSRPKPALPFGGIFRIVDFTLLNCLKSKLSQVALLTQYRHDELRGYIRQGWGDRWNVPGNSTQSLICLPPASGKRYRGTADAVFQNLSIIQSNRSEYVLILSGDHVYQMDYRELLAQHLETNADVTIATIEHPLKDAAHFGVVEVDRAFRAIGFQEKPLAPRALPGRRNMALISMGVYAFKTDVLVRSLVENCDRAFGYDFGHHVIPSLIDSARVYAYDFRDEVKDSPRYWRDIGTIDSYYDASMDLVRSEPPFNPYLKDGWHPRPTLSVRTGARVCGGAQVLQSVLSPGVCVDQDSSVEESVLMPGVRVGKGVRLRRAIIEEGVQIPPDFRAGWDAEHDRKHHTVSPSGVVVVSETPKMAKPFLVRSIQRTIVVSRSAEPVEL
jgi:glucose-1-phosphate adenylyltransferase